jgi:hypothetical protein
MKYVVKRKSDGKYMGETLWEDQIESALVFDNHEFLYQIEGLVKSVNNDEKFEDSWELVEKT